MRHVPGEPLGVEFLLATLTTSPGMYQILGRIDEYDGSFPYDIPGILAADRATYSSAANRPKVFKRQFVQNVSGGALTKGMVVIKDPTGGSYLWGVDTTTTANVQRRNVAGIVLGDAQTDGTVVAPASIADDSICDIAIQGVVRARCASGVVAGDLVGTSTTAGVLAATTTADASIGRALSAAVDDGSSTYFCYVALNCEE